MNFRALPNQPDKDAVPVRYGMSFAASCHTVPGKRYVVEMLIGSAIDDICRGQWQGGRHG